MSQKRHRTFEDLEAWQGCRELRLFFLREIKGVLLESKEFALLDQMKRATRSTTNNIAEGYGRFHYQDNYRFCSIARGSLYEVLDHLIDARDEELITESQLATGRQIFEKAVACLNGYMAFLQRSIK